MHPRPWAETLSVPIVRCGYGIVIAGRILVFGCLMKLLIAI